MADFPVWVGGLSLEVKENVLHNLFYKFGPIKSIMILKDECGRSKQCGFVNFLSQEVAELAAKKLDGCQVLGQAIKTKGPLELLSTGRSTTFVPSTAANVEKKDYRPLTDCPFFVENRECFPKPGEVRKLTKTCAQVMKIILRGNLHSNSIFIQVIDEFFGDVLMLTETIFFFIQCSFRHCLAARQTESVCEKWIQKKCTDISCCKRHPKLIKQQSGTKKKRNTTCYNLQGQQIFDRRHLCMS